MQHRWAASTIFVGYSFTKSIHCRHTRDHIDKWRFKSAMYIVVLHSLFSNSFYQNHGKPFTRNSPKWQLWPQEVTYLTIVLENFMVTWTEVKVKLSRVTYPGINNSACLMTGITIQKKSHINRKQSIIRQHLSATFHLGGCFHYYRCSFYHYDCSQTNEYGAVSELLQM